MKRGDTVTATARKLADMTDLKERFGDAVLPFALDVTDPGQVQQVVQQAYAHFGKLDTLVNNAGSSLVATIEEASDDQIHDLFEANFFGLIRFLNSVCRCCVNKIVDKSSASRAALGLCYAAHWLLLR